MHIYYAYALFFCFSLPNSLRLHFFPCPSHLFKQNQIPLFLLRFLPFLTGLPFPISFLTSFVHSREYLRVVEGSPPLPLRNAIAFERTRAGWDRGLRRAFRYMLVRLFRAPSRVFLHCGWLVQRSRTTEEAVRERGDGGAGPRWNRKDLRVHIRCADTEKEEADDETTRRVEPDGESRRRRQRNGRETAYYNTAE